MIIEEMDTRDYADFAGHERVVKCSDTKAGLTAYIAIHNLNLGPALGGCRIFPYACEQAAVTDVLRLSRGMTYKSALANLKLGGGKAVIIADPKTDKTPDMMRAMGRFINKLGGDYITAEDSGTGVTDLEQIASETIHTAGVKTKQLSDGTTANGDPSPSTAYGVYIGIKASLQQRFGNDNLSGVRIAIQGVGNVGRNLIRLLLEAGAEVRISDAYAPAIERAEAIGPVLVVNNDRIHAEDVEVFSPCALGNALNMETLVDMRAPIIAGAANNQLINQGAGEYLFFKDVLYAPDYVINAGGIIDIFYEHGIYEHGIYDHKQVIKHIQGIDETLANIYTLSKTHNKPSHEMADRLAESIFLGKDLNAVA